MWQPTIDVLTDLQYKKIQVITADKNESIGWVYTIDPQSKTIVLIQFLDENRLSIRNLKLIPGQSIRDVQILDDQICDEERRRAIDRILAIDPSESIVEDEQSINDRKEKIKRWLIKNRIPINDDERSIRVFGAVEIRYPFDLDNCICANEIVLARVRGLLESMPDDF